MTRAGEKAVYFVELNKGRKFHDLCCFPCKFVLKHSKLKKAEIYSHEITDIVLLKKFFLLIVLVCCLFCVGVFGRVLTWALGS